MSTTFNKLADIKKNWYLIDLENVVVGRAASYIAKVLRGKNKPDYTPFLDCGDNIIVINADKVKFTGKKYSDKIYYWYTGYPGGIKEINAEKLLAKSPQELFKKAVERMIPKGPLGRKQLKNLYVYVGSSHPHEGQKPTILQFSEQNKKNKR